MREGPTNSGAQAQAGGLGAGAIASLTGVGLLLIFMLQNTESDRLDFLFWGFTWPLWLLTPSPTPQGAPRAQKGLTPAVWPDRARLGTAGTGQKGRRRSSVPPRTRCWTTGNQSATRVRKIDVDGPHAAPDHARGPPDPVRASGGSRRSEDGGVRVPGLGRLRRARCEAPRRSRGDPK